MIPRKLKICADCQTHQYLFSNGRCKPCATLSKLNEMKEQGITPKYHTTAIKAVSTRQQKLNSAYKVLRDQFMKEHPTCMARLESCTFKSTECHHSRGRGEYLLDDSTFKALCHSCHAYLEVHPAISNTLGFTLSRLDKV